MFGFLRIARCRLTDDDRASYRAHFCGTCHALRGFGGRPTSLLTSYDATVFTLVIGSLTPDARANARPCTAIPFRRVDVQAITPVVAEFTAAFTIALTDAKLEDDVADGGRWWAGAARRTLRSRTVRARSALAAAGYDVRLLDRLGPEQRARERYATTGAADLAGLAATTADALGAAFARGAVLAERGDAADLAERIGRSLARFVYVADALEDLTEDRRNGDFNAIDAAIIAGGSEAEAFAFARAELETLRGGIDRLPAGGQQRILTSLHATLVARLSRREASATGVPSAARLATQRGDCDCGCVDCGGCDGCGDGCSGCADCWVDLWCCTRERRERRKDGR